MLTTLTSLTLATLSIAAEFNYDDTSPYGPSHWGDHYPHCSNTENNQSPINIITSDLISNNICTTVNWNINSEHKEFKLVNNGHSIKLIPVKLTTLDDETTTFRRLLDSGSDIQYTELTTKTNTIGTFINQFGNANADHSNFCLNSIHFHWGTNSQTGSEHTINGVSSALEAHFVHFSCDFETISEAISYSKNNPSSDTYTLGVIGVLFDIGNDDNKFFEKILDSNVIQYAKYPDGINITGDSSDSSEYNGQDIVTDAELSYIIPKNRSFYGYEGSLTTPECDPIVRWHVLKTKLTISEDQLSLLNEFMSSSTDTISPNYRPIQINNNNVYDCDNTIAVNALQNELNTDNEEGNNDDNKQEWDSQTVVIIVLSCAIVSGMALIISLFICLRIQVCQKTKQTVTNGVDIEQK